MPSLYHPVRLGKETVSAYVHAVAIMDDGLTNAFDAPAAFKND